MCIRDSLAADCHHRRYHDHHSLHRHQGAHCARIHCRSPDRHPRRLFRIVGSRPGRRLYKCPVSYTHLDVYKRQLQDRLKSDGAHHDRGSPVHAAAAGNRGLLRRMAGGARLSDRRRIACGRGGLVDARR